MEKAWVDEVLGFWFAELTPDDWYSGKAELDEKVRSRFADLHQRLKGDIKPGDIDDARTALAAIIVFDQFPRNMFRGKPEAFATDNLAIGLARDAVDKELDAELGKDEKQFLYMPFMHSEISADQERCVDLFRSLENENNLKYAIEHRDIIAEYGRFPHRNKVLGRETTKAENAFLESHAGYGQ